MNRMTFLPDSTPTTADTPVELFVPIPQLVELLQTSIATIQDRADDAENATHRELALALVRQREQLLERVRILEATGEDHIYMSMYPTNPLQLPASTGPTPLDLDGLDLGDDEDDGGNVPVL